MPSFGSIRAILLIASCAAAASGVSAQSFDPQSRRSDQPVAYDPVQAGDASRTDRQLPGDSQSAAPAPATPETDAYNPDEITGSSTPAANASRDETRAGDASQRARAADGSYITTRPRLPKPNEFEKFVSQLADRPIRRFGVELLVPSARDFTAPPTTAIPSDYRINPGDELVIGLTGAVQANNVRLVVDQDGRIFIPRIGAVRVGGVAYRDLQAAIASQVSRQYRDFQISVSVGSLHGITVYVTGFATTPGSYTVSSLSTLVNAVLAAGGPSDGGSFRSIQVRRGGRLVADFDLYDFLLKGDKRADVVLQNNDVIFIAPAGAQVAVLGSVNKEAIYEVGASDTLNSALLYAGGANTVADLGRLYVLDPKGENGWQQLSPDQALTTPVARGEVLRVISSVGLEQPSQRLQALVTVSGEVLKPGRYFVNPGTTLDQVVAMAGGLTPQAYAYGAVFVRDRLRRQQQLNFDRAVDELKVSLTAEPLVSAYVRQSDTGTRLLAVNSLVTQLREREVQGRLVLQNAPDAAGVPGDFAVENNDSLFIPPQPLSVGVYGMVNSSGNFRYARGLRIRDYLALAGGYARIADRHHTFVIRANGTVLSRGEARSARALPGDTIFVPVDSERGAFWAKVRDVASLGTSGALAAASVATLSR